MATYKLYYFNATGLGEPIRYILSYGGLKFEDIRVEREDWPKHKPDMPMGQMPALEVNGKKYNQSKAICRYIARECNLAGSSNVETLMIDGAVDTMDDMRAAITTYHFQEDATFKAKLKEIAMTKMAFTLGKFEEQVKNNGGHFVGGKVTLADIYYAGLCEVLTNVLGHDINKDHPSLKKLVETIRSSPNVKAYIAKRPKTQL